MVVQHATFGIGKCGDAVKTTTKQLAMLNRKCHDVFDVSRLSPLEILDRLEQQPWVDQLRSCAAGSGASNNTAYRHLVPVLLIEGATLRRELNDIQQMLKGLSITVASKDCKVFDSLQYNLGLEQVACHQRATLIADLDKQKLADGIVTTEFNQFLQNVLRVQGDPETKSLVDSMSEIVTQLLLLGPCAQQCNKNGDCVLAVCLCDPGFEGESCSMPSPLKPGECAKNCSNHGICENGLCRCDSGWKGKIGRAHV